MFTAEQNELRSAVRALLCKADPEAETRRLMVTDEGYDSAVWKQMAVQMGLQGMHIPEEFGGAGFGYAELFLVIEEMGAALLCAPFVSTTVLGVSALLESGDRAAMKDLLPPIASGESMATLALVEGVPTRAIRRDGDYRLTGIKDFVLDGATADLILVSAETNEGPTLFAVHRGATGLTTSRLATMDLTRKCARIEFDSTPARLVGNINGAAEVVDRVEQLMCVALASECAGGARAVLEQAVDYAKQRYQFGRAIGSFQAIKHKCADMLVDAESAKSAAYHGAAVAGGTRDGLEVAASLAKVAASEAFVHAAGLNIQVHGGIGFTWEHPAHLYFKRAKSNQAMFGDPIHHRAKLAALLDL